MTFPPYVELRTHSAFSFLQAGSLPEDLVSRAAELGHAALGLGDRDGFYGSPRFHKAATAAGLRALHGVTVTVAWPTEAGLVPVELYLLVTSATGYRQLCRLLTEARLAVPKGSPAPLAASSLEGRTEGLVCLVREPLLVPSASSLVARLQGWFPGRLYVELRRHLEREEERENRFLVDFARHHRLPLVATNEVRHATPEGRHLLDLLTCLRHHTSLDAAGRRLVRNAERHLKTPAAMAALFRDLPEAVRNTRHIAERCEFTLADLGYRFPEAPLPPGERSIDHLRRLTFEGAGQRYGRISEKVRRQLEHELQIIGRLDLAGYFLVVHDIARYCREQGILAQGRGSAANSAVCYSLGITAVDPVGMELLFERFLSEERGEWPDIDIDLPSGPQRERVIQYVYRRYGERGAAMTANVITYRTRSAVREVGKVLGLAPERVDRLAKLLRRFEFRDEEDAVEAQLEPAGLDPAAPRVRRFLDLVRRLRHLPRHLGQHSGGMVIAAGRLDEVVPLEPAAMAGRVVVQWDKDDCADLGILKVDLLGLGMMAVLEESLPLIREHEGVEIDLARLPADDPKTYAMLRRADTVGVFQVESRAQMATLPRLQPRRFYDLVVEVALIRPGPVVGQMVHPYLDRRNGRAAVTYAHPSLEPILRRTLGVPLFQEQLLRMAMAVAGFTGGEAEELRRAMGFKRSNERMRHIEARLRAGMTERGITAVQQEEIVRSITSFALYGFPESHAASFALLAYASAYLRAHHLAAFTCALLNQWPMGFYHPSTIVKDAQRHGLRVRPVDVTRSGWRCHLEPLSPAPAEPRAVGAGPEIALRLGLKYVAGLREETARRLEVARQEAPFRSLADLVRRVGLRDDEAQVLADLGAFAALGHTRREALWQVAAIPRGPLFQSAEVLSPEDDDSGQEPPAAGGLPEMTALERTLADYRNSGVTVGQHLMHHLRQELPERGLRRAAELATLTHGRWVSVAGRVIVRQRPGTAKGMCFLTLEDESGLANVAVRPDVFAAHRTLLHGAALVQAEGPLQSVDGVVHVVARRLKEVPFPGRPARSEPGPAFAEIGDGSAAEDPS